MVFITPRHVALGFRYAGNLDVVNGQGPLVNVLTSSGSCSLRYRKPKYEDTDWTWGCRGPLPVAMLEAPKGEGDLWVITPETLVDVYLGHVSFGHCTSSLSGIELVIRFQCTYASEAQGLELELHHTSHH